MRTGGFDGRQATCGAEPHGGGATLVASGDGVPAVNEAAGNDALAELRRRIAELEIENAWLERRAQDAALRSARAAVDEAPPPAGLAQALQRAEAGSQRKSTFLATLSHELRTPLTGIRGMAELLRDGPLQPVQRDYVDVILRTADDFLRQVNDLLDFAKIEADRVELERIGFDLWELAEDVAQHLQVCADAKGIRFAFELAPDVPRRIVGDPLRLRQVLQNLGGNAVKFTNEGHVRLGVGTVGTAGRPLLHVAVADTGCGIPDEVAARLFEPYAQADASTARRYGGTGLGLVISRHLVRRMDGDLTFTSTVGVGTTFVLQLPIERDARAAAAHAGSGLAVVVGREPMITSMLSAHLLGCGYEVEVVDGCGALTHGRRLLVVDCAGDGEEEQQRLLAAMGSDLPPTLLIVHGAAGVADDARFVRLERPLRPTRLLRAVARLHGVAAAVPDRVLAGTLAGMTVLVAEDTPLNRRVVTAQLESMGCTVTCVPDGEAAVAAMSSGSYDLVLMDCHMPRLDGYDATRAIRAAELGSGRHTPIVALTADATHGHREQCLDAGMDDHLVKPVGRSQLQATLQRHRGRGRR